LKLKSKKVIIRTLLLSFFLSFTVSICLLLFNIPWNSIDYRAVDALYKISIKENNGPKASDQLIYLNIDNQAYKKFKTNYLNRGSISNVNDILAKLNAQAVFYDIIFSRPGNKEDDKAFAESITKLGNVYLPAGFKLAEHKALFRWESGTFFDKLFFNYIKKISEKGKGSPLYAEWALPQLDSFANKAVNSGHISIIPDPDGVLRHFPLLIKIDSLFFPSIALSLFLDYNKIPFEEISIKWGESLIIPALPEGFLEKDMIIPIDESGKIFVPYYSFWGDQKTKHLGMDSFLEYSTHPEYYDDLLEYFEGNFVLVSDVSVGSSDLGQTTIEENVPLITVHGALLNALLTNTFYQKWSIFSAALLIFPFGLLIGFSTITRSSIPLYLIGILFVTGFAFFGYYETINFRLFPVVSASGALLLVFIGTLVIQQIIVTKDQAFIKNAFSKYVPQKVVDQLLENPSLLKLGGEERVLSILFADIANFTSISESMQSTQLVSLLNEYLTNMTDIILAEGGTIDKYIGDAILAEFGVPIKMENHASAAVTTALLMQKRVKELYEYRETNLPRLKCRIGINSGEVTVGNMGSNQVFDYTVIGDAVNLASRLEGVNKRYHSQILISEFTFKELPFGAFRTRLIDIIKVKGKSLAVKIYVVYGFAADPVDEDKIKCYDAYEKGFGLYLKKDFYAALPLFEEALRFNADDEPSKLMIERIKELEDKNLDEEWDGSVTLLEK
jgi:adenylate cyclase